MKFIEGLKQHIPYLQKRESAKNELFERLHDVRRFALEKFSSSLFEARAHQVYFRISAFEDGRKWHSYSFVWKSKEEGICRKHIQTIMKGLQAAKSIPQFEVLCICAYRSEDKWFFDYEKHWHLGEGGQSERGSIGHSRRASVTDHAVQLQHPINCDELFDFDAGKFIT